MILQDLQKYLEINDPQLDITKQIERFELLKGLSFYNWDNPKDSRTFNHAIGLPTKEGKRFPLFDYEEKMFDMSVSSSTMKRRCLRIYV